MLKRGFVILVLLNLIGCKNSKKDIKTAFYHWKSRILISDFEKKYLTALNTEKIYLRLFDVDWDDEMQFPKPIAAVVNLDSFSLKNITKTKIEIIPTVFITNKTFTQLNDNQIDTLGVLIFNKILATTEGVNFKEIQLDCDWTERTRDRYFLFLKKMKSLLKPNQKLSVTLRLHQVKDSDKTGIPPVDRAMLMCYNMSNLSDPTTENSILNPDLLRGYLKNIGSYPLNLDVALPLFSWGIVLRDGEAIKIINNLNEEDIDYNFNKKSENHYILTKNTYFKSHYLYENDEIRLENAPLSYLNETADFLHQNIRNQDITISFYHLDSTVLKRYTYENLETIIRRFKK